MDIEYRILLWWSMYKIVCIPLQILSATPLLPAFAAVINSLWISTAHFQSQCFDAFLQVASHILLPALILLPSLTNGIQRLIDIYMLPLFIPRQTVVSWISCLQIKHHSPTFNQCSNTISYWLYLFPYVIVLAYSGCHNKMP